MAVKLRQLTAEYEARLIINDRLDIALAVKADGVHLGANSLPVSAARKLLGRDMIIGYSSHDIDEALTAQAEGADFVTFGPVYYTRSKAVFGEPCGVNKLAEAASKLVIPVIALGGISTANITETLAADMYGVATISAILSSKNPRSATASLLKKIEEYAQRP
jgi:thiamine-phosphate pyrophosphorylase